MRADSDEHHVGIGADGPMGRGWVNCSAVPIDSPPPISNNILMTTETLPTAKQELDQAIARLLTGVRDPEAGRKAREDMDRMREETQKHIGTVEVAVDLVRDARDQ